VEEQESPSDVESVEEDVPPSLLRSVWDEEVPESYLQFREEEEVAEEEQEEEAAEEEQEEEEPAEEQESEEESEQGPCGGAYAPDRTLQWDPPEEDWVETDPTVLAWDPPTGAKPYQRGISTLPTLPYALKGIVLVPDGERCLFALCSILSFHCVLTR
jgi:hypothetical protein